jgi:hypothetical protein
VYFVPLSTDTPDATMAFIAKPIPFEFVLPAALSLPERPVRVALSVRCRVLCVRLTAVPSACAATRSCARRRVWRRLRRVPPSCRRCWWRR